MANYVNGKGLIDENIANKTQIFYIQDRFP
jgi:hypothetical protein